MGTSKEKQSFACKTSHCCILTVYTGKNMIKMIKLYIIYVNNSVWYLDTVRKIKSINLFCFYTIDII